jgi:nucleoside 2-deoxyribosyltransferase
METRNLDRPILYLAGGFRSGWQRKVHDRLSLNYLVLDPSAHGIRDRVEYTKWDLDAVKKSDIVLAFMESSNPGGYSLALEVGYAYALGKTILFVDDVDQNRARLFDMVHAVASRVFASLDEAIETLASPGNSSELERVNRRNDDVIAPQ